MELSNSKLRNVLNSYYKYSELFFIHDKEARPDTSEFTISYKYQLPFINSYNIAAYRSLSNQGQVLFKGKIETKYKYLLSHSKSSSRRSKYIRQVNRAYIYLVATEFSLLDLIEDNLISKSDISFIEGESHTEIYYKHKLIGVHSEGPESILHMPLNLSMHYLDGAELGFLDEVLSADYIKFRKRGTEDSIPFIDKEN